MDAQMKRQQLNEMVCELIPSQFGAHRDELSFGCALIGTKLVDSTLN